MTTIQQTCIRIIIVLHARTNAFQGGILITIQGIVSRPVLNFCLPIILREDVSKHALKIQTIMDTTMCATLFVLWRVGMLKILLDSANKFARTIVLQMISTKGAWMFALKNNTHFHLIKLIIFVWICALKGSTQVMKQSHVLKYVQKALMVKTRLTNVLKHVQQEHMQMICGTFVFKIVTLIEANLQIGPQISASNNALKFPVCLPKIPVEAV